MNQSAFYEFHEVRKLQLQLATRNWKGFRFHCEISNARWQQERGNHVGLDAVERAKSAVEFVDTNQEHVPTSKIDHFLAELWTFFLHVESFLQLEDFVLIFNLSR